MRSFVAIGVALVACAGMWLYVDRVLVAYQKTEAAVQGTPRGNLSDLYPSWLASREFLLHHRDPYSPEITREIQAGYYGRPLNPAKANDPKNQQAFAYPVFVAFLLAPTVKLPFAEAQELWRFLLAGLTVISIFLWTNVTGFRPSGSVVLAVVILVFSTFPVVQGIKLQQLTLLAAPFIAASVFCLAKNWQIPAGIFAALATIKPQLAALLILWLCLWAFSKFVLRWKLVASFLISMALLVGVGQLLLPGWPHEFLSALRAYVAYNGTRSLLDELLSHSVGIALQVCLVIAVAITCWRARRSLAGSKEFIWSTSLVLASTLLMIPMFAPYNQLLLLPGAFLILDTWDRLLWVNGAIRAIRGAAAGCLVWSWVSAIVLAIASFFTVRVQLYWAVPLWTSLLFPVLLILCLVFLVYFPPRPVADPVQKLTTSN